MNDLDRDELEIHQLLSAAKPASPPIGFRDAVMRRVRSDGPATRWEWVFAAVLALPSLAYLVWGLTAHGAELGASISAILVAAQGLDQTSGADIVVDGLVVISLALVGIGSAVAAHAMLRGSEQHRMTAR
ncbi:MAG: hypothetical protein M3P16_10650 [Chloroflexota bacterium]|nr:hypothetical protein [Chloroflexota bacterium]